jgi:hypothetical protein
MAGSGGFEPPDLGSKPSRFPSYLTSPIIAKERGVLAFLTKKSIFLI